MYRRSLCLSFTFKYSSSCKDCRIPRILYFYTSCTHCRTGLSLRKFSQQLSIYNFKAKGSGKSGSISTTICGQEILERTACEMNSDFVTVRFTVGFPANGRTINAFELEKFSLTFFLLV